MNVRRAIELLQQLPPDAEVMIEAPLACAKTPIITEASSLCLPVRALRVGIFFSPHPPGSRWVRFMGTDVWGLDQGIEP